MIFYSIKNDSTFYEKKFFLGVSFNIYLNRWSLKNKNKNKRLILIKKFENFFK